MLNKFIRIINKKYSGNGNIYVIGILGAVITASMFMVGGVFPSLPNPDPDATIAEIVGEPNPDGTTRQNLQLETFSFNKLYTPTPTLPPIDTPTPTISPSNPPTTPTPTIPTTVEECLDRTVITMMIDLSASMGNDPPSGNVRKIDALNNALNDFMSSLQPNTVVGGIAFGAPSSEFTTDNTSGVKHLSGYTSNKEITKERFTNLAAGPIGGTYMRNAYEVAIQRIKNYKAVKVDQSNRYINILFSDGVPEIFDGLGPVCLGGGYITGVCWARQQDPRSTPYGLTSTNYITQMDAVVDKSYSVAIFDSRSGARGAGHTTELTTLLKTAASGSSKPYYQAIDLKNGALDPGELRSFFKSIIDDSCTS